MTAGSGAEERAEWAALATADTLHMLPTEALVASVHHLADRLLDMTEALQALAGKWDEDAARMKAECADKPCSHAHGYTQAAYELREWLKA